MIYENFKPLLAVEADLNKIKYPVLCSPKLDGIRALVLNGKLVSRNLKPIPNHYVREAIEAHADLLEGFDGELVVGSPTAENCFNVSSSGIMSRDGEPDFKFYVFDRTGDEPFHKRYNAVRFSEAVELPFVQYVVHVTASNERELDKIEDVAVNKGYEGIMLRDPNGRYKFGRSTAKEGILLKVKRFADTEATIVGFEERMHNANPATTDALGHTERSSHKENMIGRGDLGAIRVKCDLFGSEFNIGSGFDDAMRKEIWDNRDSYIGRAAKFKYQTAGMKDVPRFPVFLGFRHEGDMS